MDPQLYVSFYMGRTKPYLQAACFCERVIVDKADNSASVIRMLGRMEIQLPKNWPDKAPVPEVQSSLFVSFAAGDYTGEGKVAVIAVGPDGKRHPMVSQPLVLTEGQNANINATIKIQSPGIGTHWFEIFWNESLEARVPLQILISRSLPEMALPATLLPATKSP